VARSVLRDILRLLPLPDMVRRKGRQEIYRKNERPAVGKFNGLPGRIDKKK
jgi:hypothetical protein